MRGVANDGLFSDPPTINVVITRILKYFAQATHLAIAYNAPSFSSFVCTVLSPYSDAIDHHEASPHNTYSSSLDDASMCMIANVHCHLRNQSRLISPDNSIPNAMRIGDCEPWTRRCDLTGNDDPIVRRPSVS